MLVESAEDTDGARFVGDFGVEAGGFVPGGGMSTIAVASTSSSARAGSRFYSNASSACWRRAKGSRCRPARGISGGTRERTRCSRAYASSRRCASKRRSSSSGACARTATPTARGGRPRSTGRCWRRATARISVTESRTPSCRRMLFPPLAAHARRRGCESHLRSLPRSHDTPVGAGRRRTAPRARDESRAAHVTGSSSSAAGCSGEEAFDSRHRCRRAVARVGERDLVGGRGVRGSCGGGDGGIVFAVRVADTGRDPWTLEEMGDAAADDLDALSWHGGRAVR
jgi:hypothetical protein